MVRRQPWCSCWGPPSVSLPVFRAPLPSELRKRRGNTALFRGANSWSIDTERFRARLGVECIKDLKLQIAAREQAETAVRALASGLEAKIRRLVNANIIGIFIWDIEG